MNTIDKLEETVNVFVETREQLRSDKEAAVSNADKALKKLEAVQQTVQDLKKEISSLKGSETRINEVEEKKKQLKQQINIVIDKLNRYSNITNE